MVSKFKIHGDLLLYGPLAPAHNIRTTDIREFRLFGLVVLAKFRSWRGLQVSKSCDDRLD